MLLFILFFCQKWNMFVCMYLLAIDKKSLRIVQSLILKSEKLSN